MSVGPTEMSPASPCIGICHIGTRGLCSGCSRTSDEITRWMAMTVLERDEVMADVCRRGPGLEPVERQA